MFTLSWSVPSMALAFSLLLLSIRTDVGLSQQQPLEPLGDVLFTVLDQDKNQKVTMEEVTSQMAMLLQLLEGAGDDADEHLAVAHGVRDAAPGLFQLLDINGDKALTKSELNYVTKFETILKDGTLKDFLRESFEKLDTNGDGQLSPDEWIAISSSSSSITFKLITVKFHGILPLRGTAQELQELIQTGLLSTKIEGEESVLAGMRWLDEDGDGHIQRIEIGKAYNAFGKKFVEIAKSIKTMGPMMAMFGGDLGGMGNMMGNEL